jgi:hypothetical protein
VTIQSAQAGYFCHELYEREAEIRLYERACVSAEDLMAALKANRWKSLPGLIRRLVNDIATARSVTTNRAKFGP